MTPAEIADPIAPPEHRMSHQEESLALIRYGLVSPTRDVYFLPIRRFSLLTFLFVISTDFVTFRVLTS